MRYLLLVCADETIRLSPEEGAAMGSATESWVAEMDGRGVRLHGDRLRPVSEARTVRVRGGEVLVSDGPFAETKEQIAGFEVLKCTDLDEAIEVASRHPVARLGRGTGRGAAVLAVKPARHPIATLEWARQWPGEEAWKARKSC